MVNNLSNIEANVSPIQKEFKIWQHKMETILERPGPEQVAWELFME